VVQCPQGYVAVRSTSSLTGVSMSASSQASMPQVQTGLQCRSSTNLLQVRDGRSSVPTAPPSFLVQQPQQVWQAPPVSVRGYHSPRVPHVASSPLSSAQIPCHCASQPSLPSMQVASAAAMFDQVPNRAIAEDMSIAFMPYFLIKDMDGFLEVCQQCSEQVKLETLCLSYGFAVSTGPHSNMAFCRAMFASAEGVLAHLLNLEDLFKDGLCKYGELVSLQIHGPKVELEKLNNDPMIQDMNPEFFELLPGSFEIVELPTAPLDIRAAEVHKQMEQGYAPAFQAYRGLPKPARQPVARSSPPMSAAARSGNCPVLQTVQEAGTKGRTVLDYRE